METLLSTYMSPGYGDRHKKEAVNHTTVGAQRGSFAEHSLGCAELETYHNTECLTLVAQPFACVRRRFQRNGPSLPFKICTAFGGRPPPQSGLIRPRLSARSERSLVQRADLPVLSTTGSGGGVSHNFQPCCDGWRRREFA